MSQPEPVVIATPGYVRQVLHEAASTIADAAGPISAEALRSVGHADLIVMMHAARQIARHGVVLRGNIDAELRRRGIDPKRTARG